MLLALLLSACVHSGRPFYPLGIYGVPNTNDLATVRAAGFNLVTGPASSDYLTAARAANLRVLAYPGTSAGQDFAADRARAYVAAFDSHPALWGWYLCDEPDLNHVRPEPVRNANRFLKSVGAQKPTVLVLNHGDGAETYGGFADVVMVDRYPVPWLPLANCGQHIQLARLGLGKKKPLLAVIQAFDWNSHPDLVQGESNLRAPTFDEMRCMTYCALAQGATGLFYYAFDDGKWQVRDHPVVWSALQAIAAEVNERQPLFTATRLWWPKDHRFNDPATRFNDVLESSITSVLLHVRKGNAAVLKGNYVLAVNNTQQSIIYSYTVPSPAVFITPVLGENRSLTADRGWLTDSFAPYAVHIYGPLP